MVCKESLPKKQRCERPDMKREKCDLHYAAKYGNTEAATLLISKGANLNATAALYQLARRPEKLKVGWTPLHYAVRSDQAALVQLLLKHGANPATQSKQKETPYELAWIEYREEALWALTDSGGMRRRGQGSRLIGRRQLPPTSREPTTGLSSRI